MLQLMNVNKHYGKKHALIDFNFTFRSGIYSLLGPNGAGKSTLMNIITENIKPDKHSKILYSDKEIGLLGSQYREKIGYMPQHQNLYDNFTAMRFMYYIAALKDIPHEEANEQIPNLLKQVELFDVKDKKTGGFSGGMKQRLLLAQTLLGNPEIIILDEPSAGLDPKQRATVRHMIQDLAKDQHRTIIISTHIISDIEKISSDILFIKEGRLIDSGPVDELLGVHEQGFTSLEELYLHHFGEEVKPL